MKTLLVLVTLLLVVSPTQAFAQSTTQAQPAFQEYAVPRGAGPHDVAPSPEPNGKVWYTAQRAGALGWLEPVTGQTRQIPLGNGSAPHGVIVGPDGAPWVTDGGLNAIVRVDPKTEEVKIFRLPGSRNVNLDTAAFDNRSILWFTGQGGVYGRLDPATGAMEVFDAPRGQGLYGINSTRQGVVYYASLAGNYLGQINSQTNTAKVLEPPTPNQGTRRVWINSKGRAWTSQWNAGQVGLYDPETDKWREWKLPGEHPFAYAVYVDENDKIWLSDWGTNALVKFDPETEKFEAFPFPSGSAGVRQILGRKGKIWAAESAVDKIVVLRTGGQ